MPETSALKSLNSGQINYLINSVDKTKHTYKFGWLYLSDNLTQNIVIKFSSSVSSKEAKLSHYLLPLCFSTSQTKNGFYAIASQMKLLVDTPEKVFFM